MAEFEIFADQETRQVMETIKWCGIGCLCVDPKKKDIVVLLEAHDKSCAMIMRIVDGRYIELRKVTIREGVSWLIDNQLELEFVILYEENFSS
jgi:hypothetical protein